MKPDGRGLYVGRESEDEYAAWGGRTQGSLSSVVCRDRGGTGISDSVDEKR